MKDEQCVRCSKKEEVIKQLIDINKQYWRQLKEIEKRFKFYMAATVGIEEKLVEIIMNTTDYQFRFKIIEDNCAYLNIKKESLYNYRAGLIKEIPELNDENTKT